MWRFLKSSAKLLKNVKRTGAISQTSKQVEKEISANVDPNIKQIIVEFGAGPGNITKEILSRMHPESLLLAFEIENDFLKDLGKINDKRLKIINDSAEKIQEFLEGQKADIVISSIPITILPKEVYDNIMNAVVNNLKENGYFSQVLYSKQSDRFKIYFSDIRTKRVFNIPPAVVHHCRV